MGKRHVARVCLAVLALLCLALPQAYAAPLDDCAAGRHQYVETRRVPATATEDGEVDFTCSVCGHMYSDIIFATDHIWSQWITERAATCTQAGQRRRDCTRAQRHSQYETIPALGHAYAAASRKEPACLEPGWVRYECSNDASHAYTEQLPAHGGHSFGSWREVIPAQQGIEGKEERSCERCGTAETRPLEALPMPVTQPPTQAPTQPPTEAPTTQPPRTAPVLDIVLVGANTVSLGFFAFLLIPYFLCLAYAKRRRRAVEERDALRKEVDALDGYR